MHISVRCNELRIVLPPFDSGLSRLTLTSLCRQSLHHAYLLIGIWCQLLEPAAFLLDTVFAARGINMSRKLSTQSSVGFGPTIFCLHVASQMLNRANRASGYWLEKPANHYNLI